MNLSSLQSLSKIGEDSSRQFKVDVRNVNSLAAEMVAFANCEGGDIYIGVADNGNLEGLDPKDLSRINQLISNAASQHVRSPLNVLTKNIALNNGRVIIVVTIPKGIDKPYFDKNGIIWLKCGADKRRINSKEELRRVFQNVAQFHADELPTKAGIDKLDKLRFRDFIRDVYQLEYPDSIKDQTNLLQNLNLVTEDGALNLAGALLFAERPEWIRPQFIIKAIRYPGNDFHPSDYLDSEDFSGPMDKMFKDALAFIMRNLHKLQAGKGVNYPGKPEVPESVFEELLVNALSHRDYMISAPIRLFIFDNRVEIVSPGHLPNNLTVEKIKAGNTNIRNPILVSFVAKGILPYKGLGSGIKRALESWPAIDFKDDRDGCMFSAIIYRREFPVLEKVRNYSQRNSYLIQEKHEKYWKYARNNPGNVLQESPVSSVKNSKRSRKRSEIIVEQLRQDPNMTISRLAEALQITTRAVEKQLAGLKKAGRIRRIGPNKGGFWEVTE
ncbi:putative DNA binding domain-containing protein [bacterium]|nr:putative DNA binding domain-containing protein [bacterium]